jgi:hypothetical protein
VFSVILVNVLYGGVDTLEQMGKIFYKYGFDSIFVHFSVDINKCYLLHSLTVTFADVIYDCWCHKGLGNILVDVPETWRTIL